MTQTLLPLPCLIADIGGTNSRFAVLNEDGTLTDLLTFPIAEGSDFAAEVAERVIPAFASRPRSALLALAGLIDGERVKIVNGGWYVEPRRLQTVIGLDEVVLINDFEALALALPALQDNDLVRIGGGRFAQEETKLVIGPGTGLGIAALIPAGDRWLPVATEGGHMDFGPAHPREFEIWPFLSPTGARVQVETVLSGRGIENLYRAIVTVEGAKPEPFKAAEVVTRAEAGDVAASEALDIFAACLGRLAGDMVLLYLSRGGVFVAGGIPPRIVDRFTNGIFRSAFVDKAPFHDALEAVGTTLVVHKAPAFVGAAELIRDPSRFAIDLSKRHWR